MLKRILFLLIPIFIFSQQLPTPVYPLGYSEIKIASALASEYRNQGISTKYAPESSYDNNLNTEFHSIKDSTSFPLTLKYEFEHSSKIRKLDYYPRTDDIDIDGHWKELEIKIYYNDNTTEVIFNNIGNGFTQFDRAYSPEENFFYTIDFNQTYENVNSLEFIFHSGQLDMITVAEIDFWEPSESQFDPTTIFADEMFSELKEGVTIDDINAISDNEYFKNYALELYNNTYNKEFRIQHYKAYPHPSSIGGDLRIYAQSRCSNVTGIYLETGDEIFVASDRDVELLQVNFWPHAEGDPSTFDPQVNPLDDQQVYYAIKKGVNKIVAEQTGLFYVQYWSDNYSSEPNLQLHFMYGRINGYFDGRVRTREEWDDVLSIAKYPYYDVIGDYVQITFPLSGFKQLTDNGKDLIDLYDELNYLAREIHGHIDIPGSEIPNHSHMAGVYKKYKYASPYAVFYNVSDANDSWENAPTLEKNFNYALLKEDFFGTVHEWGHTMQIRQAMNWGNLTETTCNISAYYAWVEKLGHDSSKELNSTSNFGTRYEQSWDTFFVKDNSFADELSDKMAMFWQLYLYNTKVLGLTDFYPSLHERARRSDSSLKEEHAMLNFTYLVAQSSNKDFTNFFDKWNFFKEGTYVAGDYYGPDTFEMTPEIIDQYRNKVKALNLEIITDAVEYITDSNFNLFKNKTEVVAGSYEIINNQLIPLNWTGVVAYENYVNGQLSNIYLNANPIDLFSQNDTQEIYAVQFDGIRKPVYTYSSVDDCSECICGSSPELINQDALDNYAQDSTNNFLPVPSGLSDRDWTGSTVSATVNEIEANFTAARNLDSTVYSDHKTFEIPQSLKVKVCPDGGSSCLDSDKIEKWFLLSIQEKGLFILNSERAARGLPTFQGVSTEVVSIAQQYADALANRNSGLSHNLSLTINGVQTSTPWERLASNQTIRNNSEFYGFAENLAYTANNPKESNIPIEHAIYLWNYNDSSSNWGHRNFNLSILNDNSGNEYQEGLIGFGVKKVVQSDGWIKYYTVMNAIDPTNTFDFNTALIYCNSSSLSTDSKTLKNEVIYPNPFNDQVFITSDSQVTDVTVFDLTGKTVLRISGKTQIDTSTLSSGVFIFKIATVDGVSYQKLVK